MINEEGEEEEEEKRRRGVEGVFMADFDKIKHPIKVTFKKIEAFWFRQVSFSLSDGRFPQSFFPQCKSLGTKGKER